MGKVLVIGAGGQIGTELTAALKAKKGDDQVIAADIRKVDGYPDHLFEILDVTNGDQLKSIIEKHNITEVYQLAALLSATAEQKPMLGWDLNMSGLFNVLNLAKDGLIEKIFWPSSIAVFGPTTPKENTPQRTIMEPSTVYGISKQAGERWCEWFYKNHNVDVRSIRYPGLISYTSPPGGGTTDYAVDIFYSAKKGEPFSCFLEKDSGLPMMYMEDAIRATIELMEAPAEQIKIRSSYNISGVSFTPEVLADAISSEIPDFSISYAPDFRQKIAETWPSSIDDTEAQKDWNWKAEYDIEKLVRIMLDNVKVVK